MAKKYSQITAHVPIEIHDRLRIKGGSRGVNAVVNVAIKEYLDDAKPLKSNTKAIVELRRHVSHLQRTVYAFMHQFDVFVETFFALSPYYSVDELKERKQSAQRLFSDFIKASIKAFDRAEFPAFLTTIHDEIERQADADMEEDLDE